MIVDLYEHKDGIWKEYLIFDLKDDYGMWQHIFKYNPIIISYKRFVVISHMPA